MYKYKYIHIHTFLVACVRACVCAYVCVGVSQTQW